MTGKTLSTSLYLSSGLNSNLLFVALNLYMDFTKIIERSVEIGRKVLLNPPEGINTIILAVLALVLMMIVLHRFMSFNEARYAYFLVAAANVLLMVVILLVAASWTSLYFLPKFTNLTDPMQLTLSISLVTLIFFGLGLPMTMLMFRSTFLSALGGWLIAIVISFSLVYTGQLGYTSISKVGDNVKKAGARKIELEEKTGQ